MCEVKQDTRDLSVTLSIKYQKLELTYYIEQCDNA